MKEASIRQKLLLVIFMGCVAVVGVSIAARFMYSHQRDLNFKLTQLEAEDLAIKTLIDEKPKWIERKTWLEAHQPKNSDASGVSLIQKVQETVKSHQLTLSEIVLQKAQEDEVTIAGRVEGSMENLIKWLVDLQRPQDFLSVQRLSFKCGEKTDRISCEIVLSQMTQKP